MHIIMANLNPLKPKDSGDLKLSSSTSSKAPIERKVTIDALAPSSPSANSAEKKYFSSESLKPSPAYDSVRQKNFETLAPDEDAGIREFMHSRTVGGHSRQEDSNLKSTNSILAPKKNIVAQNKILSSSVQRKKARPSGFEKMTDKDKADAYFKLQEENLHLKKDHSQLENTIKLMKSNFSRLEKGVKIEREIAENYTGKDFKSSMIDTNTNLETLKTKYEIVKAENKILVKAALTGNLNKQLLSRIDGPSLNKFNMKPKVLSGAVIFDIKKDSHLSPRSISPVQDEKSEYYRIEYERLSRDYLDLQNKLREEQKKNNELEFKLNTRSKTPESYQDVTELREKNERMEKQLADLLQTPFTKDESRTKFFQSEISSAKERALKLESQVASLQEQVRIVSIEKDKYKEDYLILSGKLQSKENYMNEFETQLRNIGGMDLNAFMKALGLMKLRGEEPAWSQLDFLEKGTMIPNDLKSLQREIERLKLEKGQLAAEVEKSQSLLTLKNEMEREKTAMYESEIEQLKIQSKSAQQRTEELARLADFRANRVIQLERNQRLNVYDDDNRIVASKTQITVGELHSSAPEFVESGTEVSTNENILDLWLGEAEFYQTALEQVLKGQVSVSYNFVTFLTVDFFNMETQTTSLCDGLRPRYNVHISFKVNITEYFIKTLEKGFIYIEGHASKGDSHVTFSRTQIPLNELLYRGGATSELNNKTGVVEGMSTYLSNFDGKTSIGSQAYKIRMRYPLSEAMRWYREKEEIVELSNPKQYALDTIYAYAGPTKSRTAVLTVFRCMGLKGQVYPGNLRPFVYFQFFTEPESFSKLSVGPDPVYDQTFQFKLTTTPELKKYLDTESLEIVVFDDNAPIKEGGQDIIGTAKIPLSALLLDTSVEGTYILYSLRGQESGKITIRISWIDSKVDQIGYGTPLSQVWEREAYQRIAKALSSRGLGMESSFNVFDQDSDGLVSPQEFRNTILITLRVPLSEQEIQLLINSCNLVEGGISKTLFRQKFSGLLVTDRTIESNQTWEEEILDRVRERIKEKNLSVWQAFAAFDENRDGFISSNEFLKTFKIMELGLTDQEIQKLLLYFDPSKTGMIDYKVFCNQIQKNSSGSWEEDIINKVRQRIQEKNLSIKQAFSAFDKNGDGIISANEFIEAFKVMELGLSVQEIKKLLSYFDTSRTGKIDYKLFCNKIQKTSSSSESWEEEILNRVRERIKEKGLSVWEAFGAFDENGDGVISSAEFTKAFNIMELGLTDQEIQKLLTYFDQSRTGSIEYKVFCNKIQKTSSQSWEEDILNRVRLRIQEKNLSARQAFTAFDQNGDGIISANEFIEAFRVMELGLSVQEIKKLLSYFDTSRTGKIDYKLFCNKIQKTSSSSESWEEEILNRVRERIKEKGLSVWEAFGAFDENGDGVISSAEFTKAFNIMELGLTDQEIQKLRTYFDQSGTGSIEYKVFCNKIQKTSSQSWEEEILNKVRLRIQEKNLSARQAFTAFDQNGDGIISTNEFIEAFKVMELGLSVQEIKKLLSYFDPKKTGSIDYKVFCNKIQNKSTGEESISRRGMRSTR
jgi:Ca2+-binding EF-hand superfamily protein